MKTTRFFTAIGLITAVWFSACTNDEPMDPNALPEGKYPLEIASVTMSVESSSEPWNAPQTRVSESDDRGSSVWQDGDRIRVGIESYADSESRIYDIQVLDNKEITVSPSTDGPVYWKSTTPNKVRAWFPADGKVDLSNQTKENGLVYALYAETINTVDYNTQDIALPFEHKLAKVRVLLEGDQADQANEIKIKTYTSCTIHADGTVTEGDAEDYISMVQTTYNSGVKCWEANVVPGHPIKDFQVNGTEGKLNGDGITPLAAKINTITLTVGENVVKDGATLTEAGEYTMSGEYTQGVTLNGDGITLTLEGASINTHGTAINIVSGNPTVKIQGTENHAKSTTSTAIHVGSGCTLTIEGVNGAADKLKAEGGKNEGTAYGSGNAGAGIGSSNGGNIVIRNVTIEAKGNTYSHSIGPLTGGSAAIGSSVPGYCGDITIANATVTATGGYWAAAIGMSGCIPDSYYPDLKIGKIHISRSVITAQGGDGASAIGFACMEEAVLSSAYAGEIYIETDETSATFLGRLTSSGNFKIGKGSYYSDRMTFYNQNGSGTWPGVTLKASDGTQTSPDGIGQ